MTTQAATRRIDVDTHCYPPVDYKALREYLPRGVLAQAQDMLVRDAMRAAEPAEHLEQVVEAIGSELFFFGTDFPHPEFRRYHNTAAAILDRPGLLQEAKDNILGNNIARCLRLG
jgi:predicted TIM-barrel fold metal-dependent hydrolase